MVSGELEFSIEEYDTNYDLQRTVDRIQQKVSVVVSWSLPHTAHVYPHGPCHTAHHSVLNSAVDCGGNLVFKTGYNYGDLFLNAKTSFYFGQ